MAPSPLRLLRRQGSEAQPSPAATRSLDMNGAAMNGTMNGTSGNDHGGGRTDSPAMNGVLQADSAHAASKTGGGGPATAGDFVPERAEATEQVVLLLRNPNAGLLSQLWRKTVMNVTLYRITFTMNCLDPWEQVLGNVLLLGSMALVCYGAWREGGRMIAFGASLLQQWTDSR